MTESTGSTGDETSDTGADTGTTGQVCVPVAADDSTCDQIDDDCNGFVDDVDVDSDGFCDCIKILILGNPGNAPNAKFEDWLAAKGTSVVRMIDSDPLTADLLASYDIVLLDQLVREYAAPEAQAVQDWVGAGGGLMAMSGYIANAVDGAKRPNSLVGPMGVEFIPKLVNGPVKTFVAHPLTEALSSVTFEGGHPVKETSGTNTFVASIGADPVAVAAERVDGRIYLWGDEWVQYDMVWDGNPMMRSRGSVQRASVSCRSEGSPARTWSLRQQGPHHRRSPSASPRSRSPAASHSPATSTPSPPPTST